MGLLLGLHHVTAMCGRPQANVDFYAGLLGLRLLKVTVNYDDPGTYHLYYGDPSGRPGSSITFFPWSDLAKGRVGTGQVGATAYSVPAGSLPYWQDRLEAAQVSWQAIHRFDEHGIEFRDPDGLRLELIGVEGVPDDPSWEGPVPAEHALRGFYSVSLWTEGMELSDRTLTHTLGFERGSMDGNRFRFTLGDGGPGQIADVLCMPDAPTGRMGVGAVHHVAWRTADEASQLEIRADVAKAGFNVTPVAERNYFRSIYFREPSHILFEVATDGPGFDADEPLETLGTRLCLPAWLEPHRDSIVKELPSFRTPSGVSFP